MEFEKKITIPRRNNIRDIPKADKSYFQELRKLENLRNAGRLVQKFLSKQADIDKILKIIQQKNTLRYTVACDS